MFPLGSSDSIMACPSFNLVLVNCLLSKIERLILKNLCIEGSLQVFAVVPLKDIQPFIHINFSQKLDLDRRHFTFSSLAAIPKVLEWASTWYQQGHFDYLLILL
jgi:hypothetical protein